MGRTPGPDHGLPLNAKYKYISFKPSEIELLKDLMQFVVEKTEGGILSDFMTDRRDEIGSLASKIVHAHNDFRLIREAAVRNRLGAKP